MAKAFDGLFGACVFMAGGILVYGLADLIDRKGTDMQTQTFEVEPQLPVSSAMRIETCKSCGASIFVPADREPHVLGYLCSAQCDRENVDHYSDERDTEGFY